MQNVRGVDAEPSRSLLHKWSVCGRGPENTMTKGTNGAPANTPHFLRRDWGGAMLIFLVAVALDIPFRSRFAYQWDSAEFTLAIREYNVALSQPHAPGYFLYVMLGRLVNCFVGDPHGSLVWLSVLGGSSLVALLYVVGVEMFGRRVGWVAALFGMTSPQVWFHSCVALMYVVDGFLVCLAVLCCWRALRHGCRWADAVMIGGVLAIIGGVRPQTVPGLAPLVVYVFWRSPKQRLAKLAGAFCVCASGTLVWLVPMVRMSGGWAVYAEAFHRPATLYAAVTFARGGIDALLWNVFFAGLYCWNGLALGVGLLTGALIKRVRMDGERKESWDAAHREALRVLALWIAPMMLMGTVVALTTQPGHVLSYLPAWIILVAVVASQLRKPAVFAVVTAIACMTNAAAFLVLPQAWAGVFYGTARTAREIRGHDRQLARIVHAIRVQLSPADTLVCHAQEYLPLGLRHLQVYLPEFEQYQLAIDASMLSPVGKPMMRVRGGRLDFAAGTDLTGRRVLALIVPHGTSLKDYARYLDVRQATSLPGSEGSVYTVRVEAMR